MNDVGIRMKFSRLRSVHCNDSNLPCYEETVIDRNFNYDFNYQQMVHLPTEVTVAPVRLLNFENVKRESIISELSAFTMYVSMYCCFSRRVICCTLNATLELSTETE